MSMAVPQNVTKDLLAVLNVMSSNFCADDEEDEELPPLKPLSKSAVTSGKAAAAKKPAAAAAKVPVKKPAATTKAAKEKLFKAGALMSHFAVSADPCLGNLYIVDPPVTACWSHPDGENWSMLELLRPSCGLQCAWMSESIYCCGRGSCR